MKSFNHILIIISISTLVCACNNSKNNEIDLSVLDSVGCIYSWEVRNDTLRIITKKNEPKVDDVPQTVNERIEDIRTWYSQIIKLGKKNCRKQTKTIYDSLNGYDDLQEFEESVSLCKLNEEFEVIEGNFPAYESGVTIHIYKRFGNIFFVFIEGGAESWQYERRYYCDKDENVIRFLEKEAMGGELSTRPNKTMKLKLSDSNIRSYISNDIRNIESILKINI